MGTTRKPITKLLFNPIFIVGIVLLAVTAFVMTNAFTASGNDKKYTAPTTLIGHWHQTKSGMPKAVMSADISEDSIKITLNMGDTNGLYWLGTFDTTQNPASKFEIHSVGNRDEMDLSIYASQQKTKQFHYDNGDLSYEFSMLGVNTTVHMSK